MIKKGELAIGDVAIKSGLSGRESISENSRHPFASTEGIRRHIVLVGIYSGSILIAHWIALLIRFEFHPPLDQQILLWRTFIWSLPVELVALLGFGQFRSLLTYFSLPDAKRIACACASSGFITLLAWYLTHGKLVTPRSIIVLSFILDTASLGCLRLGFRVLRERQRGEDDQDRPMRKIVIVGAGDVGANLAKEMMLRRDLRMHPIAFFDDDQKKWNTRVHGVLVMGRPELLAEGKICADEAVIAMPSAAGRRLREIVQIFNRVRIRFETVPSMEQLVNGVVKASQIRPVQLEDLLGRERIALQTDKIGNLVFGKVVIVTGTGGSIGSELCRQILQYSPKILVLVERCEVQMFQIEQELISMGYGSIIVPFVADILDGIQMKRIFSEFRPQLVFHAAAHKHVPLMEYQPFEAFRNNTIGTQKLVSLAIEFDADRFILISTDKAINPTSAMGASKRLAELYLQAQYRHNSPKTKLMAVRFGNVLGSSGSVIPTFKKQIASGGPVTVTHSEITRYFMTVAEAVGLVLQSATQGQGGEIFVLDMGKLVKIVDVARQLIELSGLRPDIDIEIKITGLRPGEKLYEELNYNNECMVATEHPKIMRFTGDALPYHELCKGIAELHGSAAGFDNIRVKTELQRLLPEYNPDLNCMR